jgi:hypothetical protein
MTATALLLLFGIQAAGQPPPPLIPAFFTGQTLYEICSRPNGGQCSMYVAGVLDGLFYAGSRDAEPLLCPAPLNNRQAAELVTEYLENHPDMLPRAAALGVRQALAERLECREEAEAEAETVAR